MESEVKLIIMIIILSIFNLAQAKVDCDKRTILNSVLGKSEFCFDKELSAFVSKSCQKTCEAIKFIESSKKIDEAKLDLSGGKNPSSVKCKELGGRVHLYEDEKKNQQTFCEANDGSMISTNAL